MVYGRMNKLNMSAQEICKHWSLSTVVLCSRFWDFV